MSKRTRRVIAATAAAIAFLSLITFLALHTLDQNDKWSSVLTLVLTVGGTVTSTIFSQSPRHPAPAASGGAEGGTPAAPAGKVMFTGKTFKIGTMANGDHGVFYIDNRTRRTGRFWPFR
ncbi:hypothetical protein ACWED2_42965 [Amycolatopsis sp. NPDC005003]